MVEILYQLTSTLNPVEDQTGKHSGFVITNSSNSGALSIATS